MSAVRRLVLASMSALVSIAPLWAQEPSRSDSLLPPGTTVRVTVAAREPLIGEVAYLRGNVLGFQVRTPDKLLLYTAALDSVTSLEVKTGTRRNVGHAMAKGALIGGGIGLVTGALGSGDYGAGMIPGGAMAGVMVGGAIGALAGLAGPETLWEPVPLDRLRSPALPPSAGFSPSAPAAAGLVLWRLTLPVP